MPEREKDADRCAFRDEVIEKNVREIKNLDPDGVEFSNDKSEVKCEDDKENDNREETLDTSMNTEDVQLEEADMEEEIENNEIIDEDDDVPGDY